MVSEPFSPWAATPVRKRPAAAPTLLASGRFLMAFLLPFGLYLSTTAPTVYNLDSAELTTAASTGGLLRATGYPLYLIVGKLWSQLPIGDVGYRMNVLSAVFGALTIAAADLILRKLSVAAWARLGALGLLATSRFFWAMSSAAEVYTLHTFMIACIVLALLAFARRPSALRLALCTFAVGASFGNHVATVLLAPGCVWFVLRTVGWRWLDAPRIGAATAGLALGLSQYLYLTWVYLGDPAFNYAGVYDSTGVLVPADLASFEGMWWLVSGKAFAGVMMGYSPAGFLRQALDFCAELVRSFVAIGIGPAIVGVVALRRRWATLGETVAIFFLSTTAFYVNYRVVDKDTMFLPSYLLWALFLAVGYQALDRWMAADTEHRSVAGARWVLRALAVGAVVFAIAWNGPLVDLSSDRSSYNRGTSVLARVEPGSLVVGWWSTIPVLEYLRHVEGHRPDVETLNRFLIAPDDLEKLVVDRLSRGQAVYFDEPPTDLFPDVSVERHGPIFQVHELEVRAPERTTDPSAPVTDL